MMLRILSCAALLVLPAMLQAQVIISEVNAGTPDFVELFNPTGSAVDISGWRVSTWQVNGGQNPGGLPSSEPSFFFAPGTMIAAQGHIVLEENGTANAQGNLGACAIRTGFNYNWNASRSVEVALYDGAGTGIDYMYRNIGAAAGTPNIPAGLAWSGLFSSSGNDMSLNAFSDRDLASDWGTTAIASPCAVTPGISPVSYEVTTTGVGDVNWSLSLSSNGANAEFYAFYSLEDYDGMGPLFGLGFDIIPQIAYPLIPNTPFHSMLDASGQLTLSYGPGTIPLGTTIESAAVIFTPGEAFSSAPIEINF